MKIILTFSLMFGLAFAQLLSAQPTESLDSFEMQSAVAALKNWKEQPYAYLYVFLTLSKLDNPRVLKKTNDLSDLAASAIDACEAGNYPDALARSQQLRSACEQVLAASPSADEEIAASFGLTVSLEVFRQCRDYASCSECLSIIANRNQETFTNNPNIYPAYQLLLARSCFALNDRDQAIHLVARAVSQCQDDALKQNAQVLLAWMLASRGKVVEAHQVRQQLLSDLAQSQNGKKMLEFLMALANADGLIRLRMGDVDGARKIVSKATRLLATRPSLFANDQMIELELLELDLAQAHDSNGKTLVSQPEFLTGIEQISRRTAKTHPNLMLDYQLNVLRMTYYQQANDDEKLQKVQAVIDGGFKNSKRWEAHTTLKITDDLILTLSDDEKLVRQLDGLMPIVSKIDLYLTSKFEDYRALLHVHLKEYEQADRCYAEAHKASIASTGPFSYRSIMAAAYWTDFRRLAGQDNWNEIYLDHVGLMKQAKEAKLDAVEFIIPAGQRMLDSLNDESPVVAATAWSLLEQACEHSITQHKVVTNCQLLAKVTLAKLALQANTKK